VIKGVEKAIYIHYTIIKGVEKKVWVVEQLQTDGSKKRDQTGVMGFLAGC